MLISCLTITQADRLSQLQRSIRCFTCQSYTRRELVIVHDGAGSLQREIENVVAAFPNDAIRIIGADARTPLGALRNLAVQHAAGELVCQWDDDDLYHPQRLVEQYQRLHQAGGDFCFLSDQLHWFESRGEFYWDDWNVEPYPMNLIQGTLLGRRDKLPAYPALDRGEDTPLLREIHRNGARLTALDGHGYLYIYSYSGNNAWDYRHHAAISAWKRMRKAQLETLREQLTTELRRYDLPLAQARFPHDEGEMIIDLKDGP